MRVGPKVPPPYGRSSIDNLHALRSSQIHAIGPERRAKVLHQQKWLRAMRALWPCLRQTHQPLIVGLVVPVRQEHGKESQSIHMGAWRAALFGVYRVEFEEGPSLLRLALDGASPKL